MDRAPLPDPESVFATTRRAFLRATRIIVPAVALPALAGTIWLETSRGNTSPLLWVQGVAFLLIIAGAWLTRRWPTVSSTLLLALVVIQSTTSVAMYGPLAGNGALILTACLLGIAFYGWRWGLVSAGISFGAWAGVLVAMNAGHIPLPDPAVSDLASPATWFRAGLSLLVAVVALTSLFVLVHRALETAIARATEESAKAVAAAREREEAFRALAAAQRVESIGYLAGGLAHDLRNTLTVVLAGAQALRDTPHAAAEIGADLELAASSGVESARRLLALARDHREGRSKPADVISGLARMLKPVLPEDVQLDVEASPTCEVRVGEGALSQAVLNLVVNARDAMPRGGHLTLRTRERPRLRVAVIEVEDSGAGMDPATLARAFEPLFTTKPAGHGTGLGLTMVRRTAEEAGGLVEIDSRVGRGTCVRLVLPATPVTEGATAEVASGGPAALGGEEVERPDR